MNLVKKMTIKVKIQIIDILKLFLNKFLVNKKYFFSILLFFLISFCFTQEASTISLNGEWKVIYDYDNKSGSHNIDDIIKLFDSTNPTVVKVPSCLEFYQKDFEGVAIYKKSFLVPEIWDGQNGGIWQGVHLKSFGKIKIENVFIKPDYQTHVVNLDINLENTNHEDTSSEIKIKFYDSNNNLIKKMESLVNLYPGQNLINQQIEIENAKNWDPSSPNLYKVQVEVNQGVSKCDYWSCKFGFREFTMKNGKFFLNGNEFYLKGVFFEGLYPNGVGYPDNEEMARKEIQMALDAGFNMIRPWRKPPDPKALSIAGGGPEASILCGSM